MSAKKTTKAKPAAKIAKAKDLKAKKDAKGGGLKILNHNETLV